MRLALDKSRLDHDTGCMVWEGAKNAAGYGMVSLSVEGKRKLYSAHKAYCMALAGVILPRHAYMLHTCDNASCINPEHIMPGNTKMKLIDCTNKQRKAKTYAKHTRQRKLTNALILLIRADTNKCKHTAELYGISAGYVSKIKNMKAKPLV